MKHIKHVIVLIGAVLVLGCDSENAFDCIQTAGDIIQEEVMLPEFQRILVNRDVELIIQQGDTQQVIIETGENLINDVKAEVNGDRLILTDDNTCNYVRDYGITKVYVTSPNITEIRSSTQYDISSQGVLAYNDLTLLSEDFNAPGTFTVGDFRLNVATTALTVVANNISFFYISGTTDALSVGFFSGAGRFEGADLIAQDVDIFHRGSNDMIVNPQQSLTGELRGTGDLITLNQPPVIDIEQLFTGQLIFN
ncbi:MAG: head GIN domain-containing protein [Bacteroidota bacterium]